MISFAKLLEQMEGSPVEDEAVEAVRAGINVREGFWDDFINVTSNASGMSELLGVSRDKIAGWGSRIRQVLDTIEQNDDQTASQEKASTVPTSEV